MSDGYAHSLTFVASADARVAASGDKLQLAKAGRVEFKTQVAFAPELPESIAYANRAPGDSPRWLGDTVTLHGERSRRWVQGGERRIELVVNGRVADLRVVPADGQVHDLNFEVPVEQSSWAAIRCFPQLHTNPVEIIIADRPIRASSASARWCAETIRQLWRMRANNISAEERPAAEAAFQRAISEYERRAAEAIGP